MLVFENSHLYYIQIEFTPFQFVPTDSSSSSTSAHQFLYTDSEPSLLQARLHLRAAPAP